MTEGEYSIEAARLAENGTLVGALSDPELARALDAEGFLEDETDQDPAREEDEQADTRGNVITSVGGAAVRHLGSNTITVQGGTQEERDKAWAQYLRALNGE